jgi:hypothetical protein
MARYALLQLGDGTMFGHRILSTQMMAELHRPEIDVAVDWRPAARAENLRGLSQGLQPRRATKVKQAKWVSKGPDREKWPNRASP